MDYIAHWRAGVMHLKSVDLPISTRIYIYHLVQGLPFLLAFSTLRALLPQQLEKMRDDDMDAFIATTDKALDLATIFTQNQ